jgi:hypothetical protein
MKPRSVNNLSSKNISPTLNREVKHRRESLFELFFVFFPSLRLLLNQVT